MFALSIADEVGLERVVTRRNPSPRVIDDAMELGALEDCDSLEGPSIGQFVLDESSREKVVQLEQIGEFEDVGEVKVRVAISRPQVERVVTDVEKHHVTLLIGCVGVCVRGTHRYPMTST
jgi:hypothetical protein